MLRERMNGFLSCQAFRPSLRRKRWSDSMDCERRNSERRLTGGRSALMSERDETRVTVREAGRRGGERVRDKYGAKHFSEIGEKGGKRLKEMRGAEYFAEIGKRGGRAVKMKYGPDHFSEIGQKGGNKVRELIERGKAKE
jgi:general stress protein YciG